MVVSTIATTNKMKLPTLEQINKCKGEQPWQFGNEILYKMCREKFQHDRHDVVLGKVLIIGRTYAAAVERRKNKSETVGNGDDFYINTVAPAFIKSNLDRQLAELSQLKKLNADNLQRVLEVHYSLTKMLFEITKLNKRSFSSKYLHFHLPDLFFIYDSRVVNALRDFVSDVPKTLKPLTKLKTVDAEYAKYFCKCFNLKTKTENQFNTTLTARQFDNLLIEVANKK